MHPYTVTIYLLPAEDDYPEPIVLTYPDERQAIQFGMQAGSGALAHKYEDGRIVVYPNWRIARVEVVRAPVAVASALDLGTLIPVGRS